MATQTLPPTPVDFESIPWCAEILNLPNLISRPRGSPDEFFQSTLRLNNAVHASTFLYRETSTKNGTEYEGYMLLQLGNGITGQPAIAHGGFLATVMDEVTGNLIGNAKLDRGRGMFTGYLKTNYHKPVAAPGVILAVSKVTRQEGRKIFLEAAIKDETGDVCTTAEALFIAKREAKV